MQFVRQRLGISLLILVMALAACAGGKDFDYYPDNEVPRGRGLFTGKDGYFTIYRKQIDPADQQDAVETDASTTESHDGPGK